MSVESPSGELRPTQEEVWALSDADRGALMNRLLAQHEDSVSALRAGKKRHTILFYDFEEEQFVFVQDFDDKGAAAYHAGQLAEGGFRTWYVVVSPVIHEIEALLGMWPVSEY